jgi:hypothetical protein
MKEFAQRREKNRNTTVETTNAKYPRVWRVITSMFSSLGACSGNFMHFQRSAICAGGRKTVWEFNPVRKRDTQPELRRSPKL